MKASFALVLAGAATALAQYRIGESDPSVCPPANVGGNVKLSGRTIRTTAPGAAVYSGIK
ncbi:hypothetical protein ACHAQH_007562 [Verticillium albo-atrum]